MRRGVSRALRAGALAVLLAAGCARGPEETEASALAAAREAEWRWITATKQDLDAQRARLAESKAKDPGVLAAQIDLAAQELDRRLADFINSDPPRQGEPLTARQRQALRLRSDEDIRVAREYIEEGGDYRRALEILRGALLVDPGNPRLAAEVKRLERSRFMTRARFDQVKAGMSGEEVRALLGAPNPHNVREYAGKGASRGVVAWFYPKDAAGSAAAVWFAKSADPPPAPALKVYQLDFEAVPAKPQGRPAAPARPAPTPRRSRAAATS
ncbi:MAG TPA: hypothetical protein VNJ70_06265 [Thermoanaerobaculia bacterium]|nr:hypothetical protein [Thermoanaerobaculia bacterium]